MPSEYSIALLNMVTVNGNFVMLVQFRNKLLKRILQDFAQIVEYQNFMRKFDVFIL